MKRAVWPRLGLALLVGVLAGSYVWVFTRPGFALAISTVAITAPVIAVALLNGAIRRNGAMLAGILAFPFLLIAVTTLDALYPTIWQGDTAFMESSLGVAVILLTPAAAAFMASAMPAGVLARPSAASLATRCAHLAWAVVGVQTLALPTLIQVGRTIWYFKIHHAWPPQGMFNLSGIRPLLLIFQALYAVVIYAVGFGLAALEGSVVSALLDRVLNQEHETNVSRDIS